jgi:hypothetical protein
MMGNQFQQWQTNVTTAGAPPELRNLQAEMNAKTMAIVNRFRLVNVTVALFQMGLAVALVAGGMRALAMKEAGRRLLWWACGLAILFELARAVPYVFMQLENMALMEDYFPRIMEESAPGAQGAQMAAFGKMLARFSMIMGWVIFFGWLILKLVFFGVGYYYLGQPKTKALYTKG